MKNDAKKYNVKNLPLPIHPGDTVYFVVDDQTIKPDTAESVGIDEDGRLLVYCDGLDYEIGNEDFAFLTEEDARRYIENPSSIPDSYGTIPDYRKLDLPYYPGTDFYYCEKSFPDWRWEIYEEYYTYVLFDADGSVRVGDEDSECTVMGDDVDPCFDSLRKAKAYIKNHK
jgi:hypothetical protein